MSWKCCQCGEEHFDQFDLCWKCGCDINGERSPSCATDSEQLSDSERNDLLAGREPLHWSEMDGSSLLETNGNPETQSPLGISERPPPTPFRKRLNAYFHRDADEWIPQDTFRSRMPFWMLRMHLTLTPAKSIQHIRKLLMLIHQAVQKSRTKS